MGLLKNILAFVPVVGAGIQAHDAAKATKQNLQIEAGVASLRAQAANALADQATRYGALNASVLQATGQVNMDLIKGVSDLNLATITASSDFNVGITGVTAAFNARAAEGAADILEARGGLEAQARYANADIAEMNAQAALESGQQEEIASRIGYGQVKGRQRARLAASGVALDEGSALRIQADTDYQADVDADRIKANAVRAAMGYRVQGLNERIAGDFALLNAKAEGLGKRLEAVGSRIKGEMDAFNIRFDAYARGAETKLTATHQLLQAQMDTQVGVYNTLNQARAEAQNYRLQAFGYTSQAGAARAGASNISPFFQGATAATAEATRIALALI